MTVLYTAHATSIAGRDGHVETDDKNISIDLIRPGSKDKPGTNPEQLFACGYSACFGGAVKAVAAKQNITGEVTVKADVTLNQDANGFFIGATLDVTIADIDADTAETIVQAAHQMCPYSKATRDNIDVKLIANGKPVA